MNEIGEVRSVDEIEADYPSQWILVGNPVTNDELEILKGVVLWHSADRDEVYRKAVELRPTRSAIINTREIPRGTVVIL